MIRHTHSETSDLLMLVDMCGGFGLAHEGGTFILRGAAGAADIIIAVATIISKKILGDTTL